MLTAVACLCTFVLLSLVVADGRGPYGFEDPVFSWLGAPATTAGWAVLSERLSTTPVIGVVLVLSVARWRRQTGPSPGRPLTRRLPSLAFLVSEHVAKPLIQTELLRRTHLPLGQRHRGSATAFGAWLALYPLAREASAKGHVRHRCGLDPLVAAAVMGALWHTPLDDLGSILLSIGIVAGGVPSSSA